MIVATPGSAASGTERPGPAAGATGREGFGIFTVDVEDWFHPLIKDFTRWGQFEDRVVAPTLRLLETLERTGNRGTFFVLGWIAERHPDLVRRILDGGHEVGCHGHHHLALMWMDADAFRADLSRALETLAAAGATRVVSYRAPYFSLNARTQWAIPILAGMGFEIDSSVFPLRIGYYGQRGAPNLPHRLGDLHEFPITLPSFGGVRVPVTGGFYSRLLPVSWTVAGVRRVLAAGHEPMFYIHPWELDLDHPRIRVGRFLTYRHYLRLERTREMLETLMRDFRWRSLEESLASRRAAAAPTATIR